jgi:hypothetical protein
MQKPMSSLVLADPTHALALAIIVCFSTKRLVDLYKIYHGNGTMPSMGFLRENFHEGFDRDDLLHELDAFETKALGQTEHRPSGLLINNSHFYSIIFSIHHAAQKNTTMNAGKAE